MDLLDKVPQKLRERFAEIVERTDRFCARHLNDEYKQACRELAVAVCRMGVPVERGKPESWAAGVVYAVGSANFLSDPSFEPHMRSDEIAKGIGVSVATMHSKSKAIRDALDLGQLDPRFTLPSLLEQNPLAWLIEVDGFVMDVRWAPREIQESVYEAGLIPYIPGEREGRDTDTDERARLRARYEHLRAVGRDLNQRLMELLSKELIETGARDLGLFRRGRLVLDSEDQLSVLMDHCIYDLRRDGRNAVERSLDESPPDPDSDEMLCLRAMQSAVYSLFAIESVEPGLGVTARNLLSRDEVLVADLGLAQTAGPGLVLASRMLFFEEFAMTGGAALSLGTLSGRERDAWVEKLSKMGQRTERGFADPAPVIRECLRQGAAERIRYT